MRVTRAAGYPFRGPHHESAFVAGCSLGFVTGGLVQFGPVGAALALVPTLLLTGYVGRVADRSAAGSDEPPAVRPVAALLGAGLRLAVVAASFLAVPAVYTVAVRPLLFDAVESGGALDPYVFLAASTSLLVVWGLFGYVLPAALVGVVRTGSLHAAADASALRATVSEWSYLVAWTQAALLVCFAVALAGVLLAAAPVWGLVAVPLVVYATYVSTHLVAAVEGDPDP